MVLPESLGLKDLAELLARHYGLTEGMFDVALEFQVGMGAFGPSPDKVGPGLAISVSRVGLARSPQPGPFTIDASKLKASRKRRSTPDK